MKEKPEIDPKYLSTDRDLDVASDAISITREILTMPAFQKFKPVEQRPGPKFLTREELRIAAGSQNDYFARSTSNHLK